MSRTRLKLAGLVGMPTCSGHAEPPPSSPVTTTGPMISPFTAMPVAGLPQCREYSVTANVEGKPQPLKGEACRQPDGSWHIAEQPVSAGDVYQTVHWPPPGGGVDYDAPWFWDVPFGFSIGFPVFVDVQHRFHGFGDAGRGGHFWEYQPFRSWWPFRTWWRLPRRRIWAQVTAVHALRVPVGLPSGKCRWMLACRPVPPRSFTAFWCK